MHSLALAWVWQALDTMLLKKSPRPMEEMNHSTDTANTAHLTREKARALGIATIDQRYSVLATHRPLSPMRPTSAALGRYPHPFRSGVTAFGALSSVARCQGRVQ